jgi:hypothetical protein
VYWRLAWAVPYIERTQFPAEVKGAMKETIQEKFLLALERHSCLDRELRSIALKYVFYESVKVFTLTLKCLPLVSCLLFCTLREEVVAPSILYIV